MTAAIWVTVYFVAGTSARGLYGVRGLFLLSAWLLIVFGIEALILGDLWG